MEPAPSEAPKLPVEIFRHLLLYCSPPVALRCILAIGELFSIYIKSLRTPPADRISPAPAFWNDLFQVHHHQTSDNSFEKLSNIYLAKKNIEDGKAQARLLYEISYSPENRYEYPDIVVSRRTGLDALYLFVYRRAVSSFSSDRLSQVALCDFWGNLVKLPDELQSCIPIGHHSLIQFYGDKDWRFARFATLTPEGENFQPVALNPAPLQWPDEGFPVTISINVSANHPWVLLLKRSPTVSPILAAIYDVSRKEYLCNAIPLPTPSLNDRRIRFVGNHIVGETSDSRGYEILSFDPNREAPFELVASLRHKDGNSKLLAEGPNGIGAIFQGASGDSSFQWYSPHEKAQHEVKIKRIESSLNPLPLCSASFSHHHIFLATIDCVFVIQLATGKLVTKLWGVAPSEARQSVRGIDVVGDSQLLIAISSCVQLWDFADPSIRSQVKIAKLTPSEDDTRHPSGNLIDASFRDLFEETARLNFCALRDVICTAFYANSTHRFLAVYSGSSQRSTSAPGIAGRPAPKLKSGHVWTFKRCYVGSFMETGDDVRAKYAPPSVSHARRRVPETRGATSMAASASGDKPLQGPKSVRYQNIRPVYHSELLGMPNATVAGVLFVCKEQLQNSPNSSQYWKAVDITAAEVSQFFEDVIFE